MITWQAHDGPVYDLVFTPDGRQLLDEVVCLWEVTSRGEVRRWPGSKFWCPLAVHPSGRYVHRSWRIRGEAVADGFRCDGGG